jgi:hypothetical protein
MQKINFVSHIFFLISNLPAGTLASVLKINFSLKFCVNNLFCKHYFSLLNTFMRKGKGSESEVGSRSVALRPKDMRILRIRIWIPNTACFFLYFISLHCRRRGHDGLTASISWPRAGPTASPYIPSGSSL